MTVAEYIVAYEGLVVSEATMRSADLIPAFTSVLEDMDPAAADAFVGHYADVYAALEAGDELPAVADFCLDDLFDALDAHAPAGFVFSAHEGDGACYGFWKVEDAD